MLDGVKNLIDSLTKSRLAILDAFVYQYRNDGATYDNIELVQIGANNLVIEWRDPYRMNVTYPRTFNVVVNQDDGKSINVYSFEEI